jgi:serine/threonine protein kinase
MACCVHPSGSPHFLFPYKKMVIVWTLQVSTRDVLPSVVHKNFKPSNIILDCELNPHLSDSGFAGLLPNQEFQVLLTHLRLISMFWSTSYMVPSWAQCNFKRRFSGIRREIRIQGTWGDLVWSVFPEERRAQLRSRHAAASDWPESIWQVNTDQSAAAHRLFYLTHFALNCSMPSCSTSSTRSHCLLSETNSNIYLLGKPWVQT